MNFLKKGMEYLSLSSPSPPQKKDNNNIEGQFYEFARNWNCVFIKSTCTVVEKNGKNVLRFLRSYEEGEEVDEEDAGAYEFIMGGGMEYKETIGPLDRKSFQFLAKNEKSVMKFLFEIDDDENFYKVSKIRNIFNAFTPQKPLNAPLLSPSPLPTTPLRSNNTSQVNEIDEFVSPLNTSFSTPKSNLSSHSSSLTSPSSSSPSSPSSSSSIVTPLNKQTNTNNDANTNTNANANANSNANSNANNNNNNAQQLQLNYSELGNVIAKEKVKLYLYNSEKVQYIEFGDVHISLFDNSAKKEIIYSLALSSSNNNDAIIYFYRIIGDDSYFWYKPDEQMITWTCNLSDSLPPWSCKLVFSTDVRKFSVSLAVCKWESSSQSSFHSLKNDEQQYILNAIKNDRKIEDDDDDNEEWVDDSDLEDNDANQNSDDDDDEEDDLVDEALCNSDDSDYEDAKPDPYSNSELAVGSVKRISVVARGPRVGIFKERKGKLVYSTMIETSSKRQGRKNLYNPNNMLLHEQDQSLIFLDKSKPNSVIKMDLNRGEVIDEWNIGEQGNKVKKIVATSKHANVEGTPVLLGVNNGGVFSIDMREKFKNRQPNQTGFRYPKSTCPNFTCATTTEAGNIALGTEKGEVRLFSNQQVNNFDITAKLRTKNNYQFSGNEILGIDSTADGLWILVTCKTHLFVVPTMGSNNVSAFDKQVNHVNRKDAIRLTLSNEHILEMGGKVSFTEAHFNQNERGESSIITSTGPYIVTWNFDKIKQGKVTDYKIKKYRDTVVADQFKFGDDDAVIVTLPQDVTVTKKVTRK